MSKLNLLGTGLFGFIGSNYVLQSYHKYNKIINIDKCNYVSRPDSLNVIPNIINIKDDINNLKIDEILNKYKIDIVIHFAAQTHVDNSYKYFEDFINDNIKATYNLLDGCRKYNKLIKIIHISTDEIYGPSLKLKLKEESIMNPTNPYAASKCSAEHICNTFKYSHNLPITIIRSNNVYGIGQHKEKVIPKFITQILNNENITIHGDGNKQRDFLFVNDLIDGINLIIDEGGNEIYNIGCDNTITINNLAKLLNTKLKKEIKCIFIEDRPFNDNRYYLNINKIKKLGWTSKIPFDKGIEIVINDIKLKN